MSFVKKLMAFGLSALASVVVAQPAQAQSCAGRKDRLSVYMQEAKLLREYEHRAQHMRQLDNKALDFIITYTRKQMFDTRGEESIYQTIDRHLTYLMNVRANRAAGTHLFKTENYLKRVAMQRDRVATNIAHTRAAMESMKCDGPASQQPRWARQHDQNQSETGGNASASGCEGFDGKWSTYGGQAPMVLRGGSGTYEFRGIHSTISGSVSGRKLQGNWSQPGYPDPNWRSGRFEFTLSADGNSFTGTGWANDGVTSDGWSGTCTGSANSN